jgi:hypothetical protein
MRRCHPNGQQPLAATSTTSPRSRPPTTLAAPRRFSRRAAASASLPPALSHPLPEPRAAAGLQLSRPRRNFFLTTLLHPPPTTLTAHTHTGSMNSSQSFPPFECIYLIYHECDGERLRGSLLRWFGTAKTYRVEITGGFTGWRTGLAG